ncbi:MAG TPA: hypothetical protein PLI30_13460, partial [Petrimonas sp.]|nr:hypothetical protein [Petrimonas sp.]
SWRCCRSRQYRSWVANTVVFTYSQFTGDCYVLFFHPACPDPLSVADLQDNAGSLEKNKEQTFHHHNACSLSSDPYLGRRDRLWDFSLQMGHLVRNQNLQDRGSEGAEGMYYEGAYSAISEGIAVETRFNTAMSMTCVWGELKVWRDSTHLPDQYLPIGG